MGNCCSSRKEDQILTPMLGRKLGCASDESYLTQVYKQNLINAIHLAEQKNYGQPVYYV
jgi:hypothetical protein